MYFNDHPDGSGGLQTVPLKEWQAWVNAYGWGEDSTQMKVVGIFPDFQTAMKIVRMTYPD